MRISRHLTTMLAICILGACGEKGEEPYSCKKDPKVVEKCRWFAGAMNLTASNGIMLFSRDDETLSYVVANNSPLPSIDFKPGSAYIGEFEICPYAPVYSERYQYDEKWTCINDARNVEELPWDGPPERYCELMPNGRWCKKATP
ncbi:MAG: hypothetical protein LCH56_00350 [Proteobacteria bacterium]|nr:hypothetical protein [Pseudomonadota bacterium]